MTARNAAEQCASLRSLVQGPPVCLSLRRENGAQHPRGFLVCRRTAPISPRDDGENNDDHKNTEKPVRHGDHLGVRLRRPLFGHERTCAPARPKGVSRTSEVHRHRAAAQRTADESASQGDRLPE